MNAITPEERALIDAALAKGQAKVIPQGETALFDPVVWCGISNKLVTVVTDPERAKMKSGWHRHQTYTKNRVSPAVAKRRMRVRDLVKDGLGPNEIAEKTGVSAKSIYADVNWLRKNGHAIPKFSKSPKEPVKRGPRPTSLKILELCDGERTSQEIADLVGVGKKHVHRIAKKYGKPLQPGMNGFQLRSARSAEMHKSIHELHESGKSHQQICDQLGICISTVFNSLKQGAQRQKNRRDKEVEAQQERRAKIPSLLKQGKLAKEIGALLGVSRSTIQKDIKAIEQEAEAKCVFVSRRKPA